MKKNLMIIAMMTMASVWLVLDQAEAEKFWSERPDNAPRLVNLPDLSPVVDLMDETIVNISTSASPKPSSGRRQLRPGDPFMEPDEFFERFFGQPMDGQPQQPRRSMGSGFIISKDGYIVTNNHVIDGADQIEILVCRRVPGKNVEECPKSEKYKAKLVGKDPSTDVALLKVDPSSPLPVSYLGDSSKLAKGEWVLAMGNPFGLSHSASLGIVSAKGRQISGNENRRFDDFIQTDAAINFGNSGGPLINLRGEVIGMNTAITAQGSGIGFAVPINLVKDIIAQLKETGTVSRGYLGVTIQDVTEEIKEALQLGTSEGVLVNDVLVGGPAALSGLKRGDVIISVDGQPTATTMALQKVVAKIKPGKSVELKVIREKKTVALSIKLGSLSDEEGKPAKADVDEKFDILGLIVQLNPQTKTVQVVDVEDDSGAFMAQIIPGDVIRKINQKPVTTIKSYKDLVAGLKPGSTVFLDLERENTKLFVAFRLSKK